jgi:fibronectin type 3 domain-containing protein
MGLYIEHILRYSKAISSRWSLIPLLLTLALLPSCGGSGSGGGGGTAPSTPTGLTATAGNLQVSLTWNASAGASTYKVKRGSASGGPYTTIATPSAASYTNTGLTNGTPYYYVVSAVNTVGESGNSTQVSATPVPAPSTPTGLTATAGNQQVSLTWNASTGATTYNVKRGAASGGPYTTIATPSTASYTNTGLTNGTPYYYVVSAVNTSGESANSTQASATPTGPATAVSVSVDVLSNRHPISSYIYGGSYPQDAAHVTDSGMTVVRWGGNATSRYNWQTQTSNSANDWYFSDYTYTGIGDSDTVKFIQDVKAAGGTPLMTMVMLDWVSRGDPANGTDNGQLYSYSVAKYGAQCKVRPDNSDAGNGQQTNCSTNITGNDFNDAHVPIFDDTTTACPSSAKGPCVYRKDWAAALATAFGSAPHFYDMDNESDIWGGTHHDVHPDPAGYAELRDIYLRVARGLKTWDPAAIRLGPVSCCWWFYWNGANSSDKGNHAGIDFLPWWLNEVYWQDQIAGTRSLDIFDIHAYPDGPDTSSYTLAQKKALAVSIYRDYWDPMLVSPSGTVNQPYTTNIQPNKTIAFRIPRMRAIVNATYPGTPLGITEWSAAFAGESDFSTAIGDADAYGILGRDRVYLASRWGAPDPANPNYQALKLYTNYDGSHHTFGTTSVADTNTGNPNLFSSYAALDSTGNKLTVMVLNKDSQNTAAVQFAFNGFTPSTVVSYTLAATAPTTITASSSQSWSSTMNFAPYSATLLVITGNTANKPSSEWDLNPDTIMVPASGTVSLQPKIMSGTANVTLASAVFDNFEGTTACGGTLNLTNPMITPTQPGTITVNAGSASGFCHFTVTGSDGTVTQTQSGWIVVGNPAASLAKTSGDGQTGGVGTTLTLPLKVTLTAGSSGGSASGASIFFTTNAGSLSNGTTTGSKVIAVTNSSGVASVTLTLPGTAGTVQVQAEGPVPLGNPQVIFSETAQ